MRVADHSLGCGNGSEDNRRGWKTIFMGPTDETIRLRIGGTEHEIHLSKKRHRV
jgi:hypothetical protein